jgi:MFS family permease
MTQFDLAKIQKRTVRVLVGGQMLSGFGLGATLSMGALIAEHLSGSAGLSGSAATFSTLGTAVWAIPLARLAGMRGRRVSLASGAAIAITGAALVVTAASIGSFALFVAAMFLIGAASAAALQARFAAVDLPSNRSSGKDLSLVVWATTVGAIISPNLFTPGEVLGHALGMPQYTGPFLMTVAGQIMATLVFWFGLRPDPLLVALKQNEKAGKRTVSFKAAFAELKVNATARYAMVSIALSHMVMVGIMSMTPVHMEGMAFSLVIIGFTISLHVAGMYAFAPVFGWLADKIGRVKVILLGQVIYLGALGFAGFGAHDRVLISIGLLLLGLGWSASTVAASALLATSVPIENKTNVQGLSDSMMSLSGAFGGAISGAMLALLAYPGLNLVALLPVVLVMGYTAIRHIKTR